jgi:hypothetical protein
MALSHFLCSGYPHPPANWLKVHVSGLGSALSASSREQELGRRGKGAREEAAWDAKKILVTKLR